MAVFMRQRNLESIEHLIATGKENLTEQATLPKDVVLGASIVTITGMTECILENHKGILEYTEEKMRILTKQGRIQIDGKGLQIIYYTSDEMKVSGKIEKIEFSDM